MRYLGNYPINHGYGGIFEVTRAGEDLGCEEPHSPMISRKLRGFSQKGYQFDTKLALPKGVSPIR